MVKFGVLERFKRVVLMDKNGLYQSNSYLKKGAALYEKTLLNNWSKWDELRAKRNEVKAMSA